MIALHWAELALVCVIVLAVGFGVGVDMTSKVLARGEDE